jgi:hypothetical protein
MKLEQKQPLHTLYLTSPLPQPKSTLLTAPGLIEKGCLKDLSSVCTQSCLLRMTQPCLSAVTQSICAAQQAAMTPAQLLELETGVRPAAVGHAGVASCVSTTKLCSRSLMFKIVVFAVCWRTCHLCQQAQQLTFSYPSVK